MEFTLDNAAQIGSQTAIIGNISGKGPLAIAGRVDGSVTLEGDCLVMGKATLNASIAADTIEVRGTVKGDLKARTQVVVTATGTIDGTIEATRIDIDPQARVKGRLVMPLQLPRGVRAKETRDPWAG